MEWSEVSGVEWSGVEKLDKSYIFVYFPTHFLFIIINTVIRGAHGEPLTMVDVTTADVLVLGYGLWVTVWVMVWVRVWVRD